LTVTKKHESLHRNSSGKLLKERNLSSNDKERKLLLFTQPLPSSKKKQNEDKDNRSLLSNKSSSSLHRASKEKPAAKSHFDLNSKLKQ
jgi:hypothetical protein